MNKLTVKRYVKLSWHLFMSETDHDQEGKLGSQDQQGSQDEAVEKVTHCLNSAPKIQLKEEKTGFKRRF